jgi:hypothetical protein
MIMICGMWGSKVALVSNRTLPLPASEFEMGNKSIAKLRQVLSSKSSQDKTSKVVADNDGVSIVGRVCNKSLWIWGHRQTQKWILDK